MKKTNYLLLLIFCLVALTACQNQNHSSHESTQLTIQDSLGRQVNVNAQAEPVAIFDYAILDLYQTLGLEDKVTLTATNPLPHYLQDHFSDLNRAGSLHEIDVEKTVSSQAELALIGTRSSSHYDALSQYMPTADFSLSQDRVFDSIHYNLSEIAKIYGLSDHAQDLMNQLNDEREQISQQASQLNKTALFLMYNQDELSVYGPASRFGQLYDDFNFQAADADIERSNHGMAVSYEYLVDLDPDIIFVLDRETAIDERNTQSDQASSHFEDHPLIDQLSAKKNNNIYYLTPDAWYLANGGYQAYQIMMDDVSQAF